MTGLRYQVAPHTPRMGMEAKAPDLVRGPIEGERQLAQALRTSVTY